MRDSWRSITTMPGLERAEAVGFGIGDYGYVAQRIRSWFRNSERPLEISLNPVEIMI